MGIGVGRSSSCGCNESEPTRRVEPKPKDYVAVKTYEGKRGGCAILLHYPNCTNYKGLKISVYGERLHRILEVESLDPHFCEDCISPIARFEPTDLGWEQAKRFIDTIVDISNMTMQLPDIPIDMKREDIHELGKVPKRM